MSYVTQKMEILFFPVYVLLYIPKVKKRWGYLPLAWRRRRRCRVLKIPKNNWFEQ